MSRLTIDTGLTEIVIENDLFNGDTKVSLEDWEHLDTLIRNNLGMPTYDDLLNETLEGLKCK